MKLKNILLIALFPTLLQAQVGMGQWRSHFCYNGMSQVEESPTNVFGISDGALFSINKEDNLIETYSKINGQNDFLVSFIRYNSTLQTLLIAYENGNIDLLSDDGIENIADIKNKNVSASKTPNDIIFVNEFAYISCGIGIIVVNLSKKEITDTYIIGPNSTMVDVKSTAFYGDSIYALTADGVFVAHKNNPLLVDYNNWYYRTNATLSLLENKKLVSFNNNLYLLKSTGEVYSSSDVTNFSVFNNSQVFSGLRVTDNNLLLHSSNNLLKYNQSLSLETSTGLKISDAVYNNSENIYWVASADSSGILKIQSGTIVQQFKPDGPTTNSIITIKFENNRLFALTGAPWDYDEYNGTLPGAVMIFEDDTWKNITTKEVKPFSGVDFAGVTYIAVDKADKQHYFVSTWGEGVYEFKNDAFYTRYNYTNSTLEDIGAIDRTQNIDGVCFDNNNHLWMTNEGVVNSIKILQNNGVWSQLSYTNLANRPSFDKIYVTKNNFKWLGIPRTSGGLFIIDDKGITTNMFSHEYKFFDAFTDQDGNSISVKPVYCLAEDKEENVWIGTNTGPIIFEDVDDVFNAGYRVYRPKIPRDDGSDYADYLLEGERINTIAVDGTNRKWLGTANSGAFLMSEDGLETIQHLTMENSPLLSNSILSIAINNKSGEVFFATSMGLISYMSDAADAEESYATISVYPNPVRENFAGVITINGLTDETTVKITDTTGNLVYQTKSNGGIATWNGYNNAGIKVSSGVYFVMVSNATDKNTDNVQTAVGKILILK